MNIMSGISASLEEARRNVKGSPVSFNLMEDPVLRQFRLGVGVAVTDLAEGDWVSIENERCYPLSAGKAFGGMFKTMTQDAHGILVSCIVRAAIHKRMEGLSKEHGRGAIVSADLSGSRPLLNVLGNGPKIGLLYAIENLELCRGILLFKADFDERPFPGVYAPKSEGRMEIVPEGGRG